MIVVLNEESVQCHLEEKSSRLCSKLLVGMICGRQGAAEGWQPADPRQEWPSGVRSSGLGFPGTALRSRDISCDSQQPLIKHSIPTNPGIEYYTSSASVKASFQV